MKIDDEPDSVGIYYTGGYVYRNQRKLYADRFQCA